MAADSAASKTFRYAERAAGGFCEVGILLLDLPAAQGQTGAHQMIHSGVSVIELRGVSRGAGAPAPGDRMGGGLHEVTLGLMPGALTVVQGEAADGTRTLLRVAGLSEPADGGTVLADGEATEGWTDEQRAGFRARRLGFVYAAPFLLPAMTAIENVAMPIFKLTGATPEEAGPQARELLAQVGLAGREEIEAGELALADQYAVAIARALANSPGALLVEELDAVLAGGALQQAASLLRQVAIERGMAVLLTVARGFPTAAADRVLELAGGRLNGEIALAGTSLT